MTSDVAPARKKPPQGLTPTARGATPHHQSTTRPRTSFTTYVNVDARADGVYPAPVINPGGRLPIDQIQGRDAEIERYWTILKRQGLVLSAERRIGKTHIVLKMHAEPPPGFVPVYQDLEHVHSLTELARALYRAVEDHLPRKHGWKATAVAAWSSIVPSKIGALELPTAESNWKALLETALTDVMGVLEPNQVLVLIWDELPLMLYNIRRERSPDDAIQLLDLLRGLRQRHANQLRLLFTGSIGLHLVLRDLRRDGNSNSPINDMFQDTVPPMSPDHTRALAARLLRVLPLCDQSLAPAIAAEIEAAVGGFPYYVHHVVDRLGLLPRPPATSDVAGAVADLLYADHDPAQFGYHLERIHTYYDGNTATAALLVLDLIARSNRDLVLDEVVNLARHGLADLRDESVKAVCQLLRQDHYLMIDRQTGGLAFRWPLLRRWWKETRT